jgi:hypothetical protein
MATLLSQVHVLWLLCFLRFTCYGYSAFSGSYVMATLLSQVHVLWLLCFLRFMCYGYSAFSGSCVMATLLSQVHVLKQSSNNRRTGESIVAITHDPKKAD